MLPGKMQHEKVEESLKLPVEFFVKATQSYLGLLHCPV